MSDCGQAHWTASSAWDLGPLAYIGCFCFALGSEVIDSGMASSISIMLCIKQITPYRLTNAAYPNLS